MTAFGILEVLTGVASIVRQEIGTAVREWSQWAEANPGAAAIQLDRAAGRLEAKAEARRPRRSGRKPWLARYQAAYAARLRAQAQDLRTMAVGRYCPRSPTRKPGT